MRLLLHWTIIFPILAWVLFFWGLIPNSDSLQLVACVLLILSVMSAVHHTEMIAHRVGEPYGTIILAISITVIEVAVIISLMISNRHETVSLARDTVYAATMIILNGMVGLCLFIGGLKYHEQNFSKHSVTIALVSLISIVVFTLVVPTFTVSIEGNFYSTPQLIFASFACITIYSFFLFAQTSRHREYFLTTEENGKTVIISNWVLLTSILFLIVSLGIVVLLAKTLSPSIESIITGYHLPKTLVGVMIATIILLPEGIAAINAARNNKIQTSLNLSLGSALASIGLTIPSVAVICIIFDMKISLGLDIKSIILLGLSVFTVMLSLSRGRTNIVYGVVLLVNFIAFIFLTIYP